MSQQVQIEPSIPTIDEVGISRESLTALSRPVLPLPIVNRDTGESLNDWALRLPTAIETKVIAERFGPHSQGSPLPNVQSIMYQLLMETGSAHILEIGTLFAGSTHVLARAAHATGNGMVVTIDPFGQDRVPAILQEMPRELSNLVHFYPYNSMELFLQNLQAQLEFDAVFIEGDHSYAGAHFDVFSAAQCVKPNGLIIMDNTNESGVTFAALEFLERFPNWQVLCVDEGDLKAAHELEGRLLQSLGTDQLYLIRPSGKSLGVFPLKYSISVPMSEGGNEVLLQLAAPSVAGKLNFRGQFIATHHEYHKTGGGGEYHARMESCVVESGQTCIRIPIELVNFEVDRSNHNFQQIMEVQFIAEQPNNVLELDGDPELHFSN